MSAPHPIVQQYKDLADMEKCRTEQRVTTVSAENKGLTCQIRVAVLRGSRTKLPICLSRTQLWSSTARSACKLSMPLQHHWLRMVPYTVLDPIDVRHTASHTHRLPWPCSSH